MSEQRTSSSHNSNTLLAAVQSIYDTHKKKLDILKKNRARFEEERWTDAEIESVDEQIVLLASVLGDLYRNVLHSS